MVRKKYEIARFLAIVCWVVFFLTTGVMAQEDVAKAPSCIYCGMDRAKFAHSRMLLNYDDGTVVGTCSIHCLALDLALHIDKHPLTVEVGDYGNKNLIDAEKAFWVIVENTPGVMTRHAKWAFSEKADAEKYIAANGGRLASFDEAMQAAYESMHQDVRMIREKRKMMKSKNNKAQQ